MMSDRPKPAFFDRFLYVFLILFAAYMLGGPLYIGIRGGNIPATYGLETPEFLYILALACLMVISTVINRLAPRNSLLTFKGWGEKEAWYGYVIGAAGASAYYLTLLVENFYLRWDLRFVILEAISFGFIFYINHKRRQTAPS